MIFFSILVFLALFSVLILIHEFGHFFAARAAGVRVEEFGLGMGKKLFGKKIGETEFTLNAVPFGGFVRMLGEEDASDEEGSFGRAKLWQKMVITLAGVACNFAFAVATLTVLFSIGTSPIFVSRADILTAEKAGIVKLAEPDSDGRRKILEIEKIKKPFPESLVFAVSESVRISKAIVKKVGEIPGEVLKNGRLPNEIAGPVGIAEVTHRVVPMGFLAILKLVALLSLSLGMMNLLPIPALDGGRFLFQIVEAVMIPFRIKMSQKIEDSVHFAGYLVLMGFLVAVTWNDLWRIFG